MDILNFISWIKGGRQVTTVDPAQTLLPVGLKDDRRDDGYLAGAISVSDLLALAPGGGLSGTNHVFVKADGTDVENAAELQAAYAEAITRVPSVTNRITVIAAPGYYNFGSTTFTMDTDYIDLVSLDGNRSIIFNSSNSAGTISIVTSNVFVNGVDVTVGSNKSFLITDTLSSTLSLIQIENCKGGDNSFGIGGNNFTLQGTFKDCIAGNQSFGYGGADLSISGTFTNCIAGNDSFGYGGNNLSINGTFTDCVSGSQSFGFGGNVLTLIGIFTNCIASNDSFGFAGNTVTISAEFTNCVSGSSSFGFAGNNSTLVGIFTNCKATSNSFGFAGNDSTMSGIFTDCIGGNNSFGFAGTTSVLSGTFTSCSAGSESFASYSLGTNTASGTFNSCIAGNNSYAFGGTLNGFLYYCRLSAGTFQTVTAPGRTVYCIDGNNNPNNQ